MAVGARFTYDERSPWGIKPEEGLEAMVMLDDLVDFWDIDEFASRIAELLRYPTLRRTMGEAGRRSATREGWRERAVQTVGVYYELVDGGQV